MSEEERGRWEENYDIIDGFSLLFSSMISVHSKDYHKYDNIVVDPAPTWAEMSMS